SGVPETIAEREQEVAAPPLVAGLTGLENLEGCLVVPARLLVRHHRTRPVARAGGVVDRLRGVAALGRLGEVIGELGEVGLRMLAIQRLQHLADAAVQPGPAPAAQLPLQRLPAAGVR